MSLCQKSRQKLLAGLVLALSMITEGVFAQSRCVDLVGESQVTHFESSEIKDHIVFLATEILLNRISVHRAEEQGTFHYTEKSQEGVYTRHEPSTPEVGEKERFTDHRWMNVELYRMVKTNSKIKKMEKARKIQERENARENIEPQLIQKLQKMKEDLEAVGGGIIKEFSEKQLQEIREAVKEEVLSWKITDADIMKSKFREHLDEVWLEGILIEIKRLKIDLKNEKAPRGAELVPWEYVTSEDAKEMVKLPEVIKESIYGYDYKNAEGHSILRIMLTQLRRNPEVSEADNTPIDIILHWLKKNRDYDVLAKNSEGKTEIEQLRGLGEFVLAYRIEQLFHP